MNSPLTNMHAMAERFNRELVGITPPNVPTILSFERGEFRLGHLREEVAEIETGMSEENLHDVVDGLVDIIYVAFGALVEMGVCVNGVFEEVHEANMRKARGINPKRPTDTVCKPGGWKPPDLAPYLTVTKADLDWMMDQKAIADEYTPTADDGQDKDIIPLPPKILVMGYARHGKDTAAEMLGRHRNLKFTSSSMFCAEHVIMPRFALKGFTYDSVADCFEDRVNHRGEWYQAIRDFNRPDASALGRAIFVEHDIYCGIRSKAEFNALKNTGVFDVAIWIDRSDHLDTEARQSCTVEPWMADFVVDNNGTLADLEFNLRQLMDEVL